MIQTNQPRVIPPPLVTYWHHRVIWCQKMTSRGTEIESQNKKNLLATHSHISWPSASSQCGRQGCRPETRGRRQTLLDDSRPEGAPLWKETSCCGRGSEGFCHSWFRTSCTVRSSTWRSFPRWICSPDRGLSRWGGSVWAHSLVHVFSLPLLLLP